MAGSSRGAGKAVKPAAALLLAAALLCLVQAPAAAQPKRIHRDGPPPAPVLEVKPVPAEPTPLPPSVPHQPAPLQPAAPAAAPAGGQAHALVPVSLLRQALVRAGHAIVDEGRDPHGPTLSVRSRGLVYTIQFYRCLPDAPGWMAGPSCSSLRFATAFEQPGGMTPQQANDWNRDRRFGRVWLDAEGDPHLEMDASLAGGVTAAHLADLVDWWQLLLDDFHLHLLNLAALQR